MTLSWAVFFLMMLLSVIILAHGLLARGRFFEFPFLAGSIFLVFVMPQMPGIINNAFMSQSAIVKTLFFSILCLVACWVGWALGLRGRDMQDVVFSEQRLHRVALVLSLIGAYFFYKIGHMPKDQALAGMLTGIAVAYLFFAKLLPYGFAIALLCHARRPTRMTLGIILFDLMFYFERIVIAGRRNETAEFFLMIALALWFQRGWAVPRSAVVGGLVFALVGSLAAGDYRNATVYNEKADFGAVLNIDLVGNWNKLLNEGGPEMTNAIMAIENIDEYKSFDFGIGHWNSTVFTFIPAQIVGAALKESLYIPVDSIFQSGYDRPTGSTSTGMADAFHSFWYFGFVKFLLFAWLLARIYSAAMKGNTMMQLIYMLSVVPSMLAITHFTNEIVIAWIHAAAFLTPAYLYARVRNPPFPKFIPRVGVAG
ncbi:hypothetical protein [Rhizobium sp. BK251]|uniref:hypothetical protein n=1 Tax=Rhizobium sp. BK251 TaxID=2512125 RepID=UPI0010504437|nr:hypothetical protein [Rhizobium sp. BK251]TCL75577.1 hypothetical protein EV286_101119 [Rhizobium sp. BK251]